MISVPDTTVAVVALVAPNRTTESGVKFVPVMSTEVPPTMGPLFGLMPRHSVHPRRRRDRSPRRPRCHWVLWPP